MKRKWFVLLCCVALCVLSCVAHAEGEEHMLVVCSSDGRIAYLTDQNDADVLGDGTVSYTPATEHTLATLKLENADLQFINDHGKAALPQRLELVGVNYINMTSERGIRPLLYLGDLEIFGDGKLYVQGDFLQNHNRENILCEGNLTVDGVEIHVSCKEYNCGLVSSGDMTIRNNARIFSDIENGAILAGIGNIYICDSTVASFAPSGMYSRGSLEIRGKSRIDVQNSKDYLAVSSDKELYIADEAEIIASGYIGIMSNMTSNNFEGSLKISGGRIEATGELMACAAKPDLSNYANACVYAGPSKEEAVLVEDLSTNYHEQKYLLIEPAE